MAVVISDINPKTLEVALKQLSSIKPGRVHSVVADVSVEADYARLRDESLRLLGNSSIGFVFLNAGIGLGMGGFDSAWTTSVSDFQKVMDVDLLSVFLGLRAFFPILLQQQSKSILTITASVAGLLSQRVVPISYTCAKVGAVLLAENAQAYLLENKQTHVSCHVLCPFFTDTKINEKAPTDLKRISVPVDVCIKRFEQGIERGIFYIVTPDRVSDVQTVAVVMQAKTNAIIGGGMPYQHYFNRKSLSGLKEHYEKEAEKGNFKGLLQTSKL